MDSRKDTLLAILSKAFTNRGKEELLQDIEGLLEELPTAEIEQTIYGLTLKASMNVRLEEYDLGRYSIECVISDYPSVRISSEKFKLREYIHPHVKNRNLCLGEARLPLNKAMRDGRILDAALIVKATMNTYNDRDCYTYLERLIEYREPCRNCGASGVRLGRLNGALYCSNCIKQCTQCGTQYVLGQTPFNSALCRRCCRRCIICGELFMGTLSRKCSKCSLPRPASIPNRFTRQAGMVSPSTMGNIEALIVGCGAIGSQVAKYLASMGLRKITLFDHDVVEAVNLSSQGWLEEDQGKSKVSVLSERLAQLNSRTFIISHARKYLSSWPQSRPVACKKQLIVFCCVDTMSARKQVWRSTKDYCDLFVDGRMASENLRVVTAVKGDNSYEATIFNDTEAVTGDCTNSSLIYTSGIAAGLMISQLTRWARKEEIQKDLYLNIPAAELFPTV